MFLIRLMHLNKASNFSKIVDEENFDNSNVKEEKKVFIHMIKLLKIKIYLI